jgi:hypothetical protein
MGTYRKEWDCCGSATETDAWEPDNCPFCTPAAAPAAAQLDADLPPPRNKAGDFEDLAGVYTDHEVRNIVAQYAERIRHLERELAELRAKAGDIEEAAYYRGFKFAQQPAQSIGDDSDFSRLTLAWAEAVIAAHEGGSKIPLMNAFDALIAYIDGRTASTAEDPRLEDLAALVRKLVRALRRADPTTTIADGALGYLKRKGLAGSALRAAAPSPLSGTEEANEN